MSDIIAETLANPGVTALGTVAAIAAVALWLAAAWWAYRDSARRTDSGFAALTAAGWIILSTPLLLPMALAIYAFARPTVPASDQRARALAFELSNAFAVGPSCPACSEPVESEWLRCPTCAIWLAAPCAGCGEWSTPDLEICPFCGREGRAVPDPVEHEVAAASALPAAAGPGLAQRPAISSARPALYAASRETSSARS